MPTLFCWGIYTAACVLVMYWLLFPAATARLLLENAVSAALPGGFAVHAGAARPTFPPKALFQTLTLRRAPDNGRIIFQADDLALSFAAFLPHRQPQVNFAARVYGGKVNGTLAAGDGKNPVSVPACTFTDIDLAVWRQTAAGPAQSVAGMASGWMKTGAGNGSPSRAVTFSVSIKDGTLPIPQPYSHRPAIHFSKLVISGTIADSAVTVARLTVRSDDFLTELSGAIRLADPWRRSVLSLSGTLTRSPQGREGDTKPQGREGDTKPQGFTADSFAKITIPVIIEGTFGAPRFSLKGHGN